MASKGKSKGKPPSASNGRWLKGAEVVPISDLQPHPRNYRTHPEDQIKHLTESIREHGLYRSILITRNGTILAGHGIVEAARKMGTKRIPVIRLNLDPEEPRALKILVGDNELEHLAEIDDRALSEILKQIKNAGTLLGTGYDELMLANLVFITRTNSEIKDFSAAAEWIGMPDYDQGENIIQMKINFLTEKDRDAFLKKTGVSIKSIQKFSDGKRLAFWWPLKKKDDLSSVKFKNQS